MWHERCQTPAPSGRMRTPVSDDELRAAWAMSGTPGLRQCAEQARAPCRGELHRPVRGRLAAPRTCRAGAAVTAARWQSLAQVAELSISLSPVRLIDLVSNLSRATGHIIDQSLHTSFTYNSRIHYPLSMEFTQQSARDDDETTIACATSAQTRYTAARQRWDSAIPDHARASSSLLQSRRL